MLELIQLLLIVVGSYALLTLLHRVRPARWSAPVPRGRVSIAALFVVTGISHFVMPAELAQLLPPSLPLRLELVAATGVLELVGALGLLIPGLARTASVALILFLLAVLPANIYGALTAAPVGGHALGPVYLLVRVPFQLFLIGWLYAFGIHLGHAQGAGIARAA